MNRASLQLYQTQFNRKNLEGALAKITKQAQVSRSKKIFMQPFNVLLILKIIQMNKLRKNSTKMSQKINKTGKMN